MPRGGPGGGMPTEAWLFACGFRTVIGKLLNLSLPTGDPLAFLHPGDPQLGTCRVLICAGQDAHFGVDFHTAIIGLSPSVTPTIDNNGNLSNSPTLHYHVGELVQVNLRARSNVALSIERYFTNVSHQSNTTDE